MSSYVDLTCRFFHENPWYSSTVESFDIGMTKMISRIHRGEYGEEGFYNLPKMRAILDCVNVIKIHSPNQNITPASRTIVENAIEVLRTKLEYV